MSRSGDQLKTCFAGHCETKVQKEAELNRLAAIVVRVVVIFGFELENRPTGKERDRFTGASLLTHNHRSR
jgi:hypothetical protein